MMASKQIIEIFMTKTFMNTFARSYMCADNETCLRIKVK